jgi:dTDP-4-dehydrorhamnose reductase
MKPAILLTGVNGQVGRELSRILPQLGGVTALDRQQLDLTKPGEIRRAIRAVRPTVIVNAAAYTAVDKAESEQTIARAINADAPAVMAEEAQNIGASLVHYSTDYVFDGMKTTPYGEDDPKNPQNVYGQTKLDGERVIQQSGVPYLIFRTAWVYGPQGRNFLLTILRLATQREELRVVSDQTGAPTLSREIARATAEILTRIYSTGTDAVHLEDVSGVYHLTAAGETTWYQFAKAILEKAAHSDPHFPWLAAATNNLPLIARRVTPITTKQYPTPARRPPYSVLSNARLARTFHLQLPDWQTQLSSIFAGSSESR